MDEMGAGESEELVDGDLDSEQIEHDDEGGSWTCPLPHSHDRIAEAHYFLHRLEEEYHNPALFRFHLNAYIAAIRAVHELLQKELEKQGQVAWWKKRRKEFVEDPVLSRFARGRNLSLHQRAILQGSRVSIGLFRGRRLKLTIRSDIHSDETSEAMLERILPSAVGFFIDDEHAAIGEQLGVQRLYFVRELSDEEDVLRACFRALARTSKASAEAHNRLGAQHQPTTDEDLLDEERLGQVTVLLESDVDPTAFYRWGWIEAVDDDGGPEA